MSKDALRRNLDLLGAGSYPLAFIPIVLRSIVQMHAIPSVSTAGIAEFNGATAYNQPKLNVGGVVDVSPRIEHINIAIGNAGNDTIAENNRPHWQPYAIRMIDDVIQVTLQRKLVGSQTFWFQGMRTGHGKPAAEMLTRLHDKAPDKHIVVQSVIPEDADQRPKAVTGYQLFHELQASGTIAVTVLSDNASAFAKAFKLSTQDQFQANAIASLLAAQAQFRKNKSLAEIGRSLGEHSPFAGWAFSSRSLEPVNDRPAWALLRALRPSLPHRGQGFVGHVVREAKSATVTALTEPSARTIDDPVDLTQPFFVLYTVPMPLAETVAWEALSNELRRWLAVTYANAIPVFVSGSGIPDPRFIGSYWLQASVLWSLPAVPTAMRAYVQAKPSFVVPELAPLPVQPASGPRVSTNGAVPEYVPGV